MKLPQVQKIIDESPKFQQKTKEWLDYRKDLITASSAASIIYKTQTICDLYNKVIPSDYHIQSNVLENCNSYSNEYIYFRRKLGLETFKGTIATFHGEKFEDVCAKYYEYQTGLKLNEISIYRKGFLGASPDGITDCGRMLEIKSPFSRKIIQGYIPLNYFIQVQLQLHCCDLEVCDYIECEFTSYTNLDYFLEKSDPKDYRGLVIEIQKITGPEWIRYCPKELQIPELTDFIKQNTRDIKDPFTLCFWKMSKVNLFEIKRDQVFIDELIRQLEIKYTLFQDIKKDPKLLETLPGCIQFL
jgi:putative phage-type endonuclease